MMSNAYPGLTSPEVVADPDAFHRRLRAEAPVQFDEVTASYLAIRNSAVRAAYRTPTFSDQELCVATGTSARQEAHSWTSWTISATTGRERTSNSMQQFRNIPPS
jgi:hypothetical protein